MLICGREFRMSDSVKLVECPRDAWQGLKGQIPAYIKTDYLKALISAGFKHIDAVSFVSPKAVPQMADSEEVLKELDPPDDVEIIGIVVNEKGAQRAIATQAVRTLGFPYSVSPTFLQNNQHQTLEDAIDELEKIKNKAEAAGLDTVVYISMAFGNPYGDPWNVGEVVDAVDLLESLGVRTISLADTVGLAGTGTDSRTVFSGEFEIRLPGYRRPFAQPSRPGSGKDPGRVRRGLPPLRFRHWAGWADARSRRTLWWGTSRPRKSWRPCNKEARSCRSLSRWMYCCG